MFRRTLVLNLARRFGILLCYWIAMLPNRKHWQTKGKALALILVVLGKKQFGILHRCWTGGRCNPKKQLSASRRFHSNRSPGLPQARAATAPARHSSSVCTYAASETSRMGTQFAPKLSIRVDDWSWRGSSSHSQTSPGRALQAHDPAAVSGASLTSSTSCPLTPAQRTAS